MALPRATNVKFETYVKHIRKSNPSKADTQHGEYPRLKLMEIFTIFDNGFEYKVRKFERNYFYY